MRAMLLTLTAFAIGLPSCAPIDAEDAKPSPNAPRAPKSQPKKTSAKTSAASVEKTAEAAQEKLEVAKTETAVFAGGCFWCTELAFEQLVGVIDVESGYSGGTRASANYEDVHAGNTGHAEVIRITYDPAQITYHELLDVFFDAHDPTQLNRQGNDRGKQYRSAIFYANEEQEKLAKAKIAELDHKHVYKKKIVTKLEPLKDFYPAEDYHQNFARKNPYQPYIQGHSIPKALRVRTKHPDLIRDDEK